MRCHLGPQIHALEVGPQVNRVGCRGWWSGASDTPDRGGVVAAVLAALFGASLALVDCLAADEGLFSAEDLVGSVCLGAALSQGFSAVVPRIESWRRRFSQSESRWHVVTVVLAPPASGYVGALMMEVGEPTPAVAAAVAALSVVPFRLVMNRPWEDGFSRAEVQETVEQTRAVRADVFGPETRALGGGADQVRADRIGAGYDQRWGRRILRGEE